MDERTMNGTHNQVSLLLPEHYSSILENVAPKYCFQSHQICWFRSNWSSKTLQLFFWFCSEFRCLAIPTANEKLPNTAKSPRLRLLRFTAAKLLLWVRSGFVAKFCCPECHLLSHAIRPPSKNSPNMCKSSNLKNASSFQFGIPILSPGIFDPKRSHLYLISSLSFLAWQIDNRQSCSRDLLFGLPARTVRTMKSLSCSPLSIMLCDRLLYFKAQL